MRIGRWTRRRVLVGDGLAPADAWEPLLRDLAASWWRHMNDENFGYAFASYDQTLLAGGHGLATECEQGRRIAATHRPTSVVLTSAPRPTTKPSARSRRRGVRLRENPGSSCQAATRRLEVLSGLHKKCKSSRVLGSVNSWWFSRDAGAPAAHEV